jgi:hypothetical protein
LVDKPDAPTQACETKQDAPITPASASGQQTEHPDQNSGCPDYVMLALDAVRIKIRAWASFFDLHHGSFSALGALFIGVLTIFYVSYQKAQWQTMIQQMELSERPWLGIKGMNWDESSPFVEGKQVSAIVVYENTGKTPALYFRENTQQGVFAETYPISKMSFPENHSCVGLVDDRHSAAGITVFPNEINTLSTDYQSLDSRTVTAIRKGVRTLITMGCFVYEDEFNKIHHTKFCEFTWPDHNEVNGLSFLQCPATQYAD